MHDFTSIRNHPERHLGTASGALTRGYSLERPMTARERKVVAVLSANPTNTLTIHSEDKSRREMTRSFQCIRKRFYRARKRPLIYVATVARANGGAGYHIHALLWSYVHAPMLGGWCKELGLGWPMLRQLDCAFPGDLNYWAQGAYVLTQHDVAFGYRQDDRHERVPKFEHDLLHPQNRTLATHSPELLSALDMAKDPAVPDDALCSRLPRFSNSYRAADRPQRRVA